MGEIADMIINGDLCEGCGVYMGSAGAGFPRICRDCDAYTQSDIGPVQFAKPKNAAKVACPTCGRRVKATGLSDHQRDKHEGGKSVREERNRAVNNWQPIESAPENEVVMTAIIDSGGRRNTADLIRHGKLWFFPDMSMYVYYTPTHWFDVKSKPT